MPEPHRRVAPPGAEPLHASDAGRLVLDALVAGLGLALVRAALFALRDGYFAQPALTTTAARSLLADLFAGACLAVPASLVAARLVRGRPVVRRLSLALFLLGALAFVEARLPASALHAPGWNSPRALLAHAAALVSAAGACWIVAGARARLPRLLGAAGLAACLLTAGAAALLLALGPMPPADRPSVVLLSVDTLRADRLGCYGGTSALTPALDVLASESLRFERAYTPQPFTLGAHMSLLTGLSPSVHDLDAEHALPPDVTTLAEAFSAAGYLCVALVDTVVWLHPRFGFSRGFHIYRQVEGDARAKQEQLEQILADVGEQPLFLFVHVFDAHSDEAQLPYESETDDRQRLAGWYQGAFDGCQPGAGCASELLLAWNSAGHVPDDSTRDYIAALYDAGVASIDRRLGAMLDLLAARGTLERGLLILTADHGEEFFEHGSALHGQAFEECVHVPLLVRQPGGAPTGVVGQPVSLLDLPATLGELLGVPMPPGQGRSFAAALRGEPLAAHPDVLLDSGRGSLGLVGERWKLIPTRHGFRLYDLLADPGETVDLLADGREPPPAAADCFRRLAEHEQDVRARREALGLPADPAHEGGRAIDTPLDDEALSQLRALGYLGSDS